MYQFYFDILENLIKVQFLQLILIKCPLKNSDILFGLSDAQFSL